MQREPATATTLVDDERVRVTRFDFAPGPRPVGTFTAMIT